MAWWSLPDAVSCVRTITKSGASTQIQQKQTRTVFPHCLTLNNVWYEKKDQCSTNGKRQQLNKRTPWPVLSQCTQGRHVEEFPRCTNSVYRRHLKGIVRFERWMTDGEMGWWMDGWTGIGGSGWQWVAGGYGRPVVVDRILACLHSDRETLP